MIISQFIQISNHKLYCTPETNIIPQPKKNFNHSLNTMILPPFQYRYHWFHTRFSLDQLNLCSRLKNVLLCLLPGKPHRGKALLLKPQTEISFLKGNITTNLSLVLLFQVKSFYICDNSLPRLIKIPSTILLVHRRPHQ